MQLDGAKSNSVDYLLNNVADASKLQNLKADKALIIIEASAAKFGEVDRLKYFDSYQQSLQNVKLDLNLRPIQLVSRRTNGKYQGSKLGVEIFDLGNRPNEQHKDQKST